MAWQLQEAKQQLSKVVDLAGSEGPQVVTRHGRAVAVVLSMEDYRALGGGDLKDALREFADAGEGVFDDVLEGVVADRARSLPRGDSPFS
jgi:prevent-host-death family protein